MGIKCKILQKEIFRKEYSANINAAKKISSKSNALKVNAAKSKSVKINFAKVE